MITGTYKATKPIHYLVDGRSWKPGDAVLLSTIPPGIATMWIEKGIVVADEPMAEPAVVDEGMVDEPVADPAVTEATPKPMKKRGRPRKTEGVPIC